MSYDSFRIKKYCIAKSPQKYIDSGYTDCRGNGCVALGGRLLQGISSGLMVSQGISLITILFDNQQKRTMALGIYGSFAGVASVLGQFLGGILPDQNWIEESW